jgi:DnaJ homolog subfamily C member 13
VATGSPPGAGTAIVKGPVSCTALLDGVRGRGIPAEASVWAVGMATPTPIAAVRQLRWMLAPGSAGVKWPRVAAVATQALQALVGHAPSPSPPEKPTIPGSLSPEVTPLVPTPRVIQRLAAPVNLPHIAQLMLTHDPALMTASAELLIAVARVDTAALHHLYTTGVFFFALAYVGRDLEAIGELFQETHTAQFFQGAQDAATRANLPMGERSILGTLLPESLLYQLEAYGPKAFAAQMTRCGIIFSFREMVLHVLSQHVLP